MRFWSAALLVISCGMMGLIIASSYHQRVKNLRQLALFIQLLESEIHFVQTTLPDILKKVGSQFSGPFRRFLQSLKKGLQEGSGDSFADIWIESTGILEAIGFPSQVVEDLRGFSIVLGSSDVAEQEKHLTLLLKRVEQSLEEAQAERNKQTKLWQYLGFCIGLLLVLLLF